MTEADHVAEAAEADDAPRERTRVLRLGAERSRLVVLGDPHGDLIGLDLVLAREAGPDAAFVSVGDNVGYADGVISSYFCQVLAERGIPSVYGNHEDWSRDGRLVINETGGSSQLTPEALAYCAALPYRLKVRAAARPGLRLHVVHTLPGWAYVNTDEAERLLDLEEPAQVVCSGHTHRASIYTVRPGKKPRVRRLDPRKDAPVRVALEPSARYVVDAGSLARPTGRGRGPCPERGTYAVLDLAAGWVELRSVDKLPKLRELWEAAAGR